jgi:hypothetical protein
MPPPPSNQKPQPINEMNSAKSRWAVWWKLIGLLLIGGLLTGLFINRQSLYDWWRLRSYQPPAAVQQLAAQDTMTDYAKRLFYLNRPQLLSSVKSFREHCPDSRDTVVLGCYHPNQAGIYIYNVKDAELQGVSQVTAAHEDLHAVYERLSDKDRRYVNRLLQDYYDHGLTDQRVQSEIKLYQKTEPNAVLDEMHSTFGTEIAELPAPLEAYYKRYFKDRSAVVAYQQRYQQAFSARQQVVAADDQQLAAMKSQIDSRQAQLSNQLTQIQAAKSRMDGLLASGQDAAYNATVDSYNAQINNYNASVASLRAYIKAYNDLAAARNAIADQINVLNHALDTRLSPKAIPAETSPN